MNETCCVPPHPLPTGLQIQYGHTDVERRTSMQSIMMLVWITSQIRINIGGGQWCKAVDLQDFAIAFSCSRLLTLIPCGDNACPYEVVCSWIPSTPAGHDPAVPSKVPGTSTSGCQSRQDAYEILDSCHVINVQGTEMVPRCYCLGRDPEAEADAVMQCI